MQSVRGCVLAVPLHSRNPCAIYALYKSIASKVYYKFTFVVCRTKKNQLGVQTQFTGAGPPFSVSQERHAPGGTLFCLLRRSEKLPPWYPPFGQN